MVYFEAMGQYNNTGTVFSEGYINPGSVQFIRRHSEERTLVYMSGRVVEVCNSLHRTEQLLMGRV